MYSGSVRNGDVFTLQNMYPGSDRRFVSFRSSDLGLRAIYDETSAMPVQFVGTDDPTVFKMKNMCIAYTLTHG